MKDSDVATARLKHQMPFACGRNFERHLNLGGVACVLEHNLFFFFQYTCNERVSPSSYHHIMGDTSVRELLATTIAGSRPICGYLWVIRVGVDKSSHSYPITYEKTRDQIP